jgi:hypothetical protein
VGKAEGLQARPWSLRISPALPILNFGTTSARPSLWSSTFARCIWEVPTTKPSMVQLIRTLPTQNPQRPSLVTWINCNETSREVASRPTYLHRRGYVHGSSQASRHCWGALEALSSTTAKPPRTARQHLRQVLGHRRLKQGEHCKTADRHTASGPRPASAQCREGMPVEWAIGAEQGAFNAVGCTSGRGRETTCKHSGRCMHVGLFRQSEHCRRSHATAHGEVAAAGLL